MAHGLTHLRAWSYALMSGVRSGSPNSARSALKVAALSSPKRRTYVRLMPVPVWQEQERQIGSANIPRVIQDAIGVVQPVEADVVQQAARPHQGRVSAWSWTNRRPIADDVSCSRRNRYLSVSGAAQRSPDGIGQCGDGVRGGVGGTPGDHVVGTGQQGAVVTDSAGVGGSGRRGTGLVGQHCQVENGAVRIPLTSGPRPGVSLRPGEQQVLVVV